MTQPTIPKGCDAPKLKIAVLVGEVGGDEARVAREHLTGLAHEHDVAVQVVPFQTVEDLARDAEAGNLDAAFVWRRSELAPVEARLGGIPILSFASARGFFVGRAAKPGLAPKPGPVALE